MELEWGSIFYKHIGKHTHFQAKESCLREGKSVHLPIPRFHDENVFYRTYFGDQGLWLDLFDDGSGIFKSSGGQLYMAKIQSIVNTHYSDEINILNFNWIKSPNLLEQQQSSQAEKNQSVIMTETGEWEIIDQNALINSICVYNIIDQTCSKCHSHLFCRFQDQERKNETCVCPNNREGDYCEIDACAHCQSGLCKISTRSNEFECVCPTPLYGKNCESSKKIAQTLFLNSCYL